MISSYRTISTGKVPWINGSETTPKGFISELPLLCSGIIDVITPPISLVWLTPEGVVGPATGSFRVVCNLQGLCCFQPTKPSPLQFKVK
jgi:hypothetical protein